MAPQPQPTESYLSADRLILKFCAVFGLPSVQYDRNVNRLRCTRLRRNCTVLAVIVHFVAALYLFDRVQLQSLYQYPKKLSTLSDTFRGLSITYAYQLLVCVALVQRRRYTVYFHRLCDVDRNIWLRFGVLPDGRRVRRAFWRHIGGWLANYVLLAWPSAMYYYGTTSLADCLFIAAYMVTAIGQGVATVFVQYAVHSYQVRFGCIRQMLAAAVADGCGQRRLDDVMAAMHLLSDLDEVKEHLSNGFGKLLVCKLVIDALNAIVSVYFSCYKLIHRSGADLVRAMMDYVTYELPFIVSNVVMVGYFQAVGDEVSKAKTPGSMLFDCMSEHRGYCLSSLLDIVASATLWPNG